MAGVNVYIIPSDDTESRKLCNRILNDIVDIVPVAVVYPPDEYRNDVENQVNYIKSSGNVTGLLNEMRSFVEPGQNCTVWFHPEQKSRTINPDLLACMLMNRLPYRYCENANSTGSIYIYRHGVYVPISVGEFEGIISEFIPVGYYSSGVVQETKKRLISNLSNRISYDKLDAAKNVINFQNGIYDAETDTFSPHTPVLLSSIQIKGNYIGKEFSTEGVFLEIH